MKTTGKHIARNYNKFCDICDGLNFSFFLKYIDSWSYNLIYLPPFSISFLLFHFLLFLFFSFFLLLLFFFGKKNTYFQTIWIISITITICRILKCMKYILSMFIHECMWIYVLRKKEEKKHYSLLCTKYVELKSTNIEKK